MSRQLSVLEFATLEGLSKIEAMNVLNWLKEKGAITKADNRKIKQGPGRPLNVYNVEDIVTVCINAVPPAPLAAVQTVAAQPTAETQPPTAPLAQPEGGIDLVATITEMVTNDDDKAEAVPPQPAAETAPEAVAVAPAASEPVSDIGANLAAQIAGVLNPQQ